MRKIWCRRHITSDCTRHWDLQIGSMKNGGCYVGKASQAMQISVDEKGCSVSAYCEVVGMDKGTAVVRKKNMNCDRPFLVVISDRNGMPIFAGAVNQPNS